MSHWRRHGARPVGRNGSRFRSARASSAPVTASGRNAGRAFGDTCAQSRRTSSRRSRPLRASSASAASSGAPAVPARMVSGATPWRSSRSSGTEMRPRAASRGKVLQHRRRARRRYRRLRRRPRPHLRDREYAPRDRIRSTRSRAHGFRTHRASRPARRRDRGRAHRSMRRSADRSASPHRAIVSISAAATGLAVASPRASPASASRHHCRRISPASASRTTCPTRSSSISKA